MIFCDIGNTYFHFCHNGRIWKENEKTLSFKDGEIFYISVNPRFESKLLKLHPKAINLATYFELDTGYKGLGIDRVAVCSAIEEGVIVDAGSAITIDVMQGGMHLGGCILLGLSSAIKAYADISPALNMMPDLSIELDLLPQSTKEALGYGILKGTIGMIEEISKEKQIYFCGGDGKFFSKFFPQSLYDETLIFRGMKKAWENYNEKTF